jgi:hypothetical protein
MLLRNVSLGLSLGIAAAAFAPAASATTFPIGTIPNFYITSGTPFSSSISANFGNGFNTSTSFDDSFTFTIPFLDGIGSGSISTSFTSAANHLVITDLWINGTHYNVPTTSSGQELTVGGIPIMHGVMNTIEVAGHSGLAGGSYSGTATFSALAVPEAATWTMMLAGFGLLGATMRRRRTSLNFADA